MVAPLLLTLHRQKTYALSLCHTPIDFSQRRTYKGHKKAPLFPRIITLGPEICLTPRGRFLKKEQLLKARDSKGIANRTERNASARGDTI